MVFTERTWQITPRGSSGQCPLCLETYVQPSMGAEGLGRTTHKAGEKGTSQGCPPALTEPAAEEAGICFRKKIETRSLATLQSESGPRVPPGFCAPLSTLWVPWSGTEGMGSSHISFSQPKI